MSQARTLLLLLLSALVSACIEVPEAEPTLTLGSAPASGVGFVSADDGQSVELIPGAQSGFHVWLAMRIEGLEGQVFVEHEARRVRDEALVLRGQRRSLDIPSDALMAPWEPENASPAFMCPSPLGLQVFDEEIVYRVRVTNADDELLADASIRLTPRCPSGPEEAFCRDICAG